jgi:hypothetical protein
VTPRNERPEPPRLPFDQIAHAILQQAHQLILARCPEVRALATSIDYHGALNDAGVVRNVWSSRDGPVLAADAVFGSLFQTLRLVEEQFATAVAVAANVREEVQNLSTEAVALRRAANEQEHAQEEGGRGG